MKVLPRRRRAVLINSVLGVVVLAGAGGAYAAVHDDGSGSSSGSGTARVATVTKTTVLATVSGSGTLASPSDAGVDFTTGGTLTEVDVKAGDKVKKGQVLAKVDPTDAEETLAEDQASLTAAQANLTKVEEGELPASTGSSGASGSDGSSGSGSGSRGGAAATPTPTPTPTVDPAQLAQAQAQVTQAQNKVDADQRAVDGCVLKAPVAGTVASVGGAKGDTVSGSSGGSGSSSGSAGGSGGSGSSGSSGSSASSGSTPTGFVVLTNPSGMQVTADFSEADSLKIKAGQAATVTLNAESGTVLNAKVLSISSLPASSGSSGGGGSSSSAVQYPATLQITSDTSNLRTGLSASIQVVTGSATNALSVPTAAVSGTGANRTVLVVNKDGSTTRTDVTVGVEGDSTDQITSGLTEGQQVQIPTVASSGSGGFPSGAFPGGIGTGGSRFGGAGGTGGGFRTGGFGGGGGR